MSETNKKFISPGAWFSLHYPADWNEFEDAEGSFLFYNPAKWSGNFRISAYKADTQQPNAAHYGSDALAYELKQNTSAHSVQVGTYTCAYSKETFQEEGEYYVTHFWILGIGPIAFECTFTTLRGGETTEAEQIISGLDIRLDTVGYPIEIIPIRISEIQAVNEAYEWVSSTTKKILKKDFTGIIEDLNNMQQLIDSDTFKPQQREAWEAFGIAFAAILINEIDGMEWVTVIEKNREQLALFYRPTDRIIYPATLIWDKKKQSQPIQLQHLLEHIITNPGA